METIKKNPNALGDFGLVQLHECFKLDRERLMIFKIDSYTHIFDVWPKKGGFSARILLDVNEQLALKDPMECGTLTLYNVKSTLWYISGSRMVAGKRLSFRFPLRKIKEMYNILPL